MNWDDLQRNWDELKLKAREKWDRLTDDDLDQAGGRRDRLADRLKQRYGYESTQAEKEADEFCRSCKC